MSLPRVKCRSVSLSSILTLKLNVLFLLLLSALPLLGQQQHSDQKALALASQSMLAMTGGTSIKDVTLTGNVSWTAGVKREAGAATLLALGHDESRVEYDLTAGKHIEVRDSQTGFLKGEWWGQDNENGSIALQNCLTDAPWFFPALSSLSGGPQITLNYVGPETRNEISVEHLRSYGPDQGLSRALGDIQDRKKLSTMDFYLDASTLLPLAGC
jgi:hypothetical protein